MEVVDDQRVVETRFFPVCSGAPVGGGRKTRVTHDSSIIVKQRVSLGDVRSDSVDVTYSVAVSARRTSLSVETTARRCSTEVWMLDLVFLEGVIVTIANKSFW